MKEEVNQEVLNELAKAMKNGTDATTPQESEKEKANPIDRKALIAELVASETENKQKTKDFIQSGNLVSAPQHLQRYLKRLASQVDLGFAKIKELEEHLSQETGELQEEIEQLKELGANKNLASEKRKMAYQALEEAQDELYSAQKPYVKKIEMLCKDICEALEKMAGNGWKLGEIQDEEGNSLLSQESVDRLKAELGRASDLWVEAQAMLRDLRDGIEKSGLQKVDFEKTERYLQGIENDLANYNFLRAQKHSQKNIGWLGNGLDALWWIGKIHHRIISLGQNPHYDLENPRRGLEKAKNLFSRKIFFLDNWAERKIGAIQVCRGIEKALSAMVKEYRNNPSRKNQVQQNRDARRAEQSLQAKNKNKKRK